MLVLSRLEGEDIVVKHPATEDRVVIKVVRTGKFKIRLGIQAPKDWLIVRAELEDKWRKN